MGKGLWEGLEKRKGSDKLNYNFKNKQMNKQKGKYTTQTGDIYQRLSIFLCKAIVSNPSTAKANSPIDKEQKTKKEKRIPSMDTKHLEITNVSCTSSCSLGSPQF